MQEMTRKERMRAAALGLETDRVPVAPDFSVMIPCRLQNKPWWDILYRGTPPLWQAYLNAAEHFGIDAWFIYGQPHYKSSKVPAVTGTVEEAFTDGVLQIRNIIHTPKGDLTSLTKYFKQDCETTPEKLIKNFKEEAQKLFYLFPEYDDCDFTVMKEQQAALGDKGLFCVSVAVPGFQSLFGFFNGNLEACTYAYYDEFELFEELIARYEKHVLSQVRLAIEGGAESILVGASGSITMQSPELWRKLSLPTIQKISKMCKDAGVISGIHSCGKSTCLVEGCALETDLDYVNPLEIPPMGDANLADLKRRLGEKITLMGNLHTTQVMLFGSPDLVRLESLKAIRDAGQGGRFILSTGDQCPRDTPEENLFAMVETARDFGQYPLNIDRIETEIARLEKCV